MNKKFLHVGSGLLTKERTTKVFSGQEWDEVRLDIDESVKPDIIASLTDMSAVESNKYDGIYSSHNIEHVYAHEVPIAFKEMYRVLNNDGFLIITCPDIQEVCAHVAKGNLVNPLYQSSMGPISPLDILYGHRASLKAGNHYMAHKVGFTGEVLYGTIKDAGFKSAVVCFKKKQFALWCIAYKELLLSKEELTQELSNHIDISL